MKLVGGWLVLGLAALVAAGCGSGRTLTGGSTTGGSTTGGSTTGGNTSGGNSGGTRTVDFASQIQPILDNNCAFSGCHASDTGSGGLVLEAGQSYGNLVNVESSEVAPDKRVVPGNSGASYIIEKLTRLAPRQGERMPLGANPLPESEIALIRTWIDEGAHQALQ
jgi:hypothetical protein